jgi:hypothetical protein
MLRPLLDARHDTPPTIVFANHAYREIADNWIRSAQRLGIRNFWFIALDRDMHDFLTRTGIQSIPLECEPGRQGIWKIRIQVFKCLVDNGVDFIHSDADAVWLRDPVDRYYTEHKDIDLVISQGTVWPPDVFTQWNFVLCCGFFVLRANRRTETLLRELETDVKLTGDDQISINRLIYRRNMRWTIGSSYRLPFRGVQLLMSENMIVGAGDGLTVGVIPFAEVPRFHVKDIRPYVEHPLAPKDNDEKKRFFQEIGLWTEPDGNHR